MRHLKILGITAAAAMALTAFLGASTASASALKIFGGSTLGVGTVLEFTLENETSLLTEDAFGFTAWTCTGSTIKVTIERVTPTGNPKGKITTLDFANCGDTTDVDANGEMEFRNIAGTTNATVFLIGTTVTEFNTLLNQNCDMSAGAGTDIGTLTAATSATTKATLDVNGLMPLINCSASNARLTGKYWVTSPLGLVSEAS